MNDPAHLTVNWKGLYADGTHEDGMMFVDPNETNLIADVEVLVLFAVSDKPFDRLLVRGAMKDGSGFVAHYEKRGQVWARTRCMTILPWWFPWFFFGVLAATVAAIGWLCWFYDMP